MKRHGTFYCRWCGYQCPAKAPVTEAQQDAGILDHRFEEILAAETYCPKDCWRRILVEPETPAPRGAPMTTIDITIGWTISDMPRYSSFDGYQAGARQHSETITLDIDTDQPMSRMVEVIAEAAFEATNSPAPQMVLAKAIKTALDATGYRGAQAHYSLSVGDTVTIGEATLACDRFGWKSVSLVPPVLVP